MSSLRNNNFGLEVSHGAIPGYAAVNKFGRSPDCDDGVPTDIWDGADATPIWVAPTAPRIHNIASTSPLDTSGGTGARTVMVYGLPDWSSAEISEVVTLDGANPVATVNSYVIIHRMVCLTFGSTRINQGNLSATAAVDGTVTAEITAGIGQTLMAIYGVPEGQDLHLTWLHASMTGFATGLFASDPQVDITLWVNERADQADSGFVTKERSSIVGASEMEHTYDPPKTYHGPCIFKVQAVSDTDNVEVTANFNGYLVDHS